MVINKALANTAPNIPKGLAYQIHQVVNKLKTINARYAGAKMFAVCPDFLAVAIRSSNCSSGIKATNSNGAKPEAGHASNSNNGLAKDSSHLLRYSLPNCIPVKIRDCIVNRSRVVPPEVK